jgi:Ca-activated chloride channel homolog
MKGFVFTEFRGQEGSVFDRLLEIFKEVLLHTSGDVDEALHWLNELDKTYDLTTPEYGMADFIQELKDRGFIQTDAEGGSPRPAAKMEIALREKSMKDIFGAIKKGTSGQHSTPMPGRGDEFTSGVRPYEFGDAPEHLAVSNSIQNAYINHGIDQFSLTNEDLEVYESFQQSQMSTVLMIDISHSMILYGEDRITPAKKVALALSEYITTRFPKDSLDIVVFGNDAWEVKMKDLPYLEVGPFHTNTVAGLELALELLRKRKNPNKQIFMITDGKPTCIKKGERYYQNSMGLDKQIISRTLSMAMRARKQQVHITTFMIARDPYLVRFVEQFTEACRGKAFYSDLEGLGQFVFKNYRK